MSIVLHGIGIGGGIAVGRAHLVSHADLEVAHYQLPANEIASEVARFDAAVKATRKELEMLWGSIPDNAPTELGAFLSLHIMLLNDHTISREPRDLIVSQQCNAEWALKLQHDSLLAQFEEIEEEYLRERRNDVNQVVERIFKQLAGHATPHLANTGSKDAILVAHDLSPADMVLFKDSDFLAFITDVGGPTSHTAILARSLDIPSVLALHQGRQLIREDELIIVDGTTGVVIIDPSPAILAEYERKQTAFAKQKRKLKSLKSTAATTLCGQPIELQANIEMPDDVEAALANGATGVGLFRSEFLFLGRDNLPTEDEQYEAYKAVLRGMKGRPVTIRTIDVGKDKLPRWADLGSATNPALSLTGIRLSLAEPGLFRTQLRALLRASVHGELKILFPMLASLAEVQQTFLHLEQVKQGLRDEGLPFADNVQFGGMIEVPAAAILVKHFVKRLDFISIGTNDLIQYTLAVDRGDDSVSHLYDPLHPAVLHLIAETIAAAHAVNVPVSICGEMAGDPQLTRLLLGLGLRRFSMHPAQLLNVKQQVLKTHLEDIAPKVHAMRETDDCESIREQLQALNG